MLKLNVLQGVCSSVRLDTNIFKGTSVLNCQRWENLPPPPCSPIPRDQSGLDSGAAGQGGTEQLLMGPGLSPSESPCQPGLQHSIQQGHAHPGGPQASRPHPLIIKLHLFFLHFNK